jgi:hypothetical protein
VVVPKYHGLNVAFIQSLSSFTFIPYLSLLMLHCSKPAIR